MRIAVTGPNGYIGSALVKAGAIPIQADVRSYSELNREIKSLRPDLVFHLAAKSSVDFCEKQENFDLTYDVNVMGVNNVFSVLAPKSIPVVFLSSYQIWSGGFFERHWENSWTELSAPPKNRYGLMKVAAESLLDHGMKIIRTSYVFDAYRLQKKLVSLLQGETLYEPVFMIRSFIHLDHFTELLMRYAEQYHEMPNILHIAGNKTVSWYSFMKAVSEGMGFEKGLVKQRFTEKEDEVPRPWNGGLDTSLSKRYGMNGYNYLDGIRRLK